MHRALRALSSLHTTGFADKRPGQGHLLHAEGGGSFNERPEQYGDVGRMRLGAVQAIRVGETTGCSCHKGGRD